jgi:Zn-finger nucleic acid-binding protein
MNCPNDNAEMHQVRIEGHYSQPILLEQCRQCGGIWFDEMELLSARNGEAEKIEVLDSKRLWIPANMVERTLQCPLDCSDLFRFRDRYFLKGIMLERCPSCNGVWLNRGDFTKFQQARQGFKRPKGKSPADESLQEDIGAILSAHDTQTANNKLEALGAFLSTPIDRATLRPLEQSGNQLGQERTGSTLLDVLMLLFMTFVRWI